jgi:hypothetical protein
MIAALAADSARHSPAPSRAIAWAIAIGMLAAAVLFFLKLGVRPDIATAVERANFLYKFVITIAVAIPAINLLMTVVRPGSEMRNRWLLSAPMLLAVGIVVELAAVPSAQWAERMIGTNAVMCLVSIPLLAAVPLICLFVAMRAGAPTRPHLAGAICGLSAAAIAATLYASHCTDDSPLFVAVWYSLAIGLVTAVASVAGGRWLRW